VSLFLPLLSSLGNILDTKPNAAKSVRQQQGSTEWVIIARKKNDWTDKEMI
jgi:hypothetical protein